jgi:hypothetical protein
MSRRKWGKIGIIRASGRGQREIKKQSNVKCDAMNRPGFLVLVIDACKWNEYIEAE